MIGININCKERDFCSLILNGKKWIETRKSPSLRPYVGKTVALIRTGIGAAKVVGKVRIVGEIITEPSRNGTCIEGTSYETTRFGMLYGYVMDNVVSCKPRAVKSMGIVSRKV